jgi:serpin B
MIPSMLVRPLPQPAIVALNALSFRGKWAAQFDAKAARQAAFYSVGGGRAPTMLMHLAEGLRAFRVVDDFVAIDLPFAGARYWLTVITTTDKPKALREFEPVKDWLSGEGFSPRTGDLLLPRFSLEYGRDLLPTLAGDLADGVASPTAFAAFGTHAKLAAILQQAKIEVDEQGAKAAASTAALISRSLALDEDKVRMVVDKPFLFALRDRESGLIFIAGYVANAPKGKG